MWKPCSPMEVTNSRPVMVAREVQDAKQPYGTVVAPIGHQNDVSPLFLKALFPIEVTTPSIPVIDMRLVHMKKQEDGTTATPDGQANDVR